MRKCRLVACLMFMSVGLLLAMSLVVSAAEVPRMSTDELKSRLGEADLVILDVRSGRDWGQSDQQIVGSERVNPGEAKQRASQYSKDRVMVLYCA